MEKTYLFYDIETTGRNKCFDQILQFAAIRTNIKLQELERYEIQIKLNCDVIPTPEASLIHQISIAEMREGVMETEAIAKIHGLLNTPGTISCGYNSLNFDDEFLRFSFHRNLLSPYTHQWADGCNRMDLFPITMLYFLFHSHSIQWPTLEGKPTLKLEYLSKENALTEGAAHNALVDVEATLALARLFARDDKMWNYTIGYFDKKTDTMRMNQLGIHFQTAQEKHRLALLIGQTGSTNFYQLPVLSLGQHHHYKNQLLWLRLDQAELATTTLTNLPDTTWVVRKKTGESGLLLPFSERFLKHLTPERLAMTKANLDWLQKNPQIFQEIITYHQQYTYPKIPHVDADAALYDMGFLTTDEQRLCHSFHTTAVEKKADIALRFTNPLLQEIAARILGRHYPEYLPETLAPQFHRYLRQIHQRNEHSPQDYRGERRLAPQTALENIDKLKALGGLNQKQLTLLEELAHYIQQQFPSYKLEYE